MATRSIWMAETALESPPRLDRHLDAEWLEADGHGGFAMGTANLARTRRYHGLLLAATTPPTGRVMLVNGFDAWVETPAGRFPLAARSTSGYTAARNTGPGSG